jgi:hypothetical protein
MLRDTLNDANETLWTGDGKRRSWRQIDRELRVLARRRCALDIEEAELLRAAVRVEVWRELGKASLREYLEEVLGYSPRLAKERVRVAIALVELPDVAEAFAAGELHWSAVRELTRIVTPTTEAEWLADVRGNNLRQIEDKVACRKRGDRPTDPARPRVARFEQLRPSTLALLRQVQQVLADERGERLDDDALLTAMCNAVLGGGAGAETGRAKHQIMTLVCEVCEQGFQDAGGRRIAIDKAAVERAQCDAQRIGSVAAPQRATQDVSPIVQRLVRRRDRGKCCVPGCRATRFLEIHHIIPRSSGGGHGADNLTLLCDGHHTALHDGKLTITGKAPDLEVRWVPSGERQETHVGIDRSGDRVGASETEEPSRFAFVALKTEVKRALVQQGFNKHEATAAVEAAATHVGAGATLEVLLFEALRRCPRPCTSMTAGSGTSST